MPSKELTGIPPAITNMRLRRFCGDWSVVASTQVFLRVEVQGPAARVVRLSVHTDRAVCGDVITPSCSDNILGHDSEIYSGDSVSVA